MEPSFALDVLVQVLVSLWLRHPETTSLEPYTNSSPNLLVWCWVPCGGLGPTGRVRVPRVGCRRGGPVLLVTSSVSRADHSVPSSMRNARMRHLPLSRQGSFGVASMRIGAVMVQTKCKFQHKHAKSTSPPRPATLFQSLCDHKP